jgi:Tfp pilus tip-associated adhesin PilY1
MNYGGKHFGNLGWQLVVAWAAGLVPLVAGAQMTVGDDFTQSTTISTDPSPMVWMPSGGACLTAAAKGASVNGIPACVGLPYYNNGTLDGSGHLNGAGQVQIGGQHGYLGDSPGSSNPPDNNGNQTPDGNGNGALRLTNGKDPNTGAHNLYQHGAIFSTTSFPASNGIQIIFKAIAYAGDSGGTGNDGADGMSFFLIDAAKWSAVYANYPSGYPATGIDSLQSQAPATGATGGSLGYQCSNTNQVNDGLVGAYIGLGIDEYGNGLNGGTNPNINPANPLSPYDPYDNTATGVPAVGWGSNNFQWNRVGLRGAGGVNWPQLSGDPVYGKYYPTSLSSGVGGQQQTAVWLTCQTGTYWDFRSSTPGAPVNTGIAVNDYAVLQSSAGVYAAGLIPLTGSHAQQIATEGAATRGAAVPIFYNLKITNTGNLSFSYSYPGFSQQVLTNVNIAGANGALPANVYFGFTASTGGADNVHEILCFKAMPANQSDTSATVTTPQSNVLTNVQLFEPTFHTNNWWGELAAYSFSYSTNTLTLNTPANWNASCVLTGGNCTPSKVDGYTNATSMTAETWQDTSGTGRQILTWNDNTSAGVAFEWGNLSANEQTNLGSQAALSYLRGNRCDEVGKVCSGVTGSLFRVRNSVLGDIVHSSPTVVGNPGKGYPATFFDNLYPTATMPENAGGAQTYPAFATANLTRQIVTYAGANDGMMHGFRAGAYNSSGTLDTTTNDGTEVLAYMPGTVVNAINSNSDLGFDYASINYAHTYFVDAPPTAGDLFYCSSSTTPSCAWHTWLVGGLGAGGSAIYALDITKPTNQSSTANFSEGNASSLVIHEWTPSNLSCANTTTASPCGSYLQNTFGKPVIGRLHNGTWAVVFGNGLPVPNAIVGSMSGTTLTVTSGFGIVNGQTVTGAGVGVGTKIVGQKLPLLTGESTGGLGRYTISISNTVSSEAMATYTIAASTNGEAGIYIMLINSTYGPFGSTGTSGSGVSVYYLDTTYGVTKDPLGQGRPNGIAYVSLSDLDYDGVYDYAYAGDVFGNVWRFDLTSNSAASWIVSRYGTSGPKPLFSTYSSGNLQPITTKVTQVTQAMGTGRLGALVIFGTGEEMPMSLATTPLNTYASGQQGVYGVWDWDMNAWNALGPEQSLATLSYSPSVPSFGYSNLTVQTEMLDSGNNNADGSISANAVTWCGANPCATGSKAGWVLNLNSSSNEQIIYNPVVQDGILEVNTVIPPSNSVYSCSDATPTGYSIYTNPTTGGSFSTSVLLNSSGLPETTSTGGVTSMVLTNAAGTGSYINTNGQTFEVSCTATGTCSTQLVQPPKSATGHRVTWTELR